MTALPIFLGLRQKYPRFRLLLLTTQSTAHFARSLGIFDGIWEIDDRSIPRLVFSTARALARTSFTDTVVDLETHSRMTSILGLLTLARNRIGGRRKRFCTRSVVAEGSRFFYDEVAELLGAEPASALECREHLRAQFRPSTAGGARALAVGHACSDLSRERMLTPEQWRRVFLAKPFAFSEVHFLGGESDRERAENLQRAIAPLFPGCSFNNHCGKIDLHDSLRLLAGCSEFWGIDSALLHYARALGLRCQSFFGPTDPAVQLKPIPGLVETIHYRKVSCSPCIHTPGPLLCGGQNRCIEGLF